MNYFDENILQKNDFTRIDNSNVKRQLVFTSENDITTLEDYYKNHIDSQSKTYSNTSKKSHDKRQRDVPNAPEEVDSRKAKRFIQSAVKMGQRVETITNGNHSLRHENVRASASEARSEDRIRNTDETERIREKRDNNPYQRKLDEVEDKDRQDRRSTQRDVQEETNRSWIAAGKTRKDGDTVNGDAMEESGGNPGKNPYQHRRVEERETRLLDNGAQKIGRLDRVEEKSASMETSGKPAKRLGIKANGNGRRDRHENEENPTTRRDRKKEGEDKDKNKEGTMFLNKNKEPGSKEATVSLDNAEEGRFAVNEEGKLPTNDEQRKAASTERRYDPEEARKLRVNSKCLQIFL